MNKILIIWLPQKEKGVACTTESGNRGGELGSGWERRIVAGDGLEVGSGIIAVILEGEGSNRGNSAYVFSFLYSANRGIEAILRDEDGGIVL